MVIIFNILGVNLVSAQDYIVESFQEKKGDMTARTHPRPDLNGTNCALLKVYVNDKILEARGNVIGNIESIGLEKGIYLTDASKQIELVFENHYPIYVDFSDYNIPSLQSGVTYLLKLKPEETYIANNSIESSSVATEMSKVEDDSKFLVESQISEGNKSNISSNTTLFIDEEGIDYYKADQLNNAKEVLNRNYNKPDIDKSMSDYYLGLIALRKGDNRSAQIHFNSGISLNPNNPYNYVGLAQLSLKRGNPQEAESYIKTAKSKVKKDSSLDIAIARAYYNVNSNLYSKEIEKYVDDAIKNSPKQGSVYINSDIYVFEGDRDRDNKNYGSAANKYEMATVYYPQATDAYIKYADLFTQVNPQYAINMLNNLLKVNPSSALGQRELANAYYNAGKYKEAANEYEQYVKNPNHFKQDEDRLAFLLFINGDYQKGYDFASNLVKQDSQNFTARRFQFMNAAQLAGMENKLGSMAKDLLSAHKNNSSNKFALIDYILLSDELSNIGEINEALNLLQEGIRENPGNRDLYKELALIYVKDNDLSKATDAFENYLKNTAKPGYNDYIQLATYAFYAGVQNQNDDSYRANNYYDLAVSSTQKAASISNDFTKPIKIQGDVAKQRASEDKVGSAAVPYFKEGIAIFEKKTSPSKNDINDAKEMYNYMGNYYLDQRNIPMAISYFEKYLKLDPNNEAYRKFVEGLKN